MGEINFKNISDDFQSLIKLAKESSKDGLIDLNEKQNLKTEAEKNGISKDEKLFLQALENKSNVSILQKSDINKNFIKLDDFKMNVSSYIQDKEIEIPIKGTIINDIGLNRFNIDMNDKNITPTSLKSQITSSSKNTNISEFLSKYGNDKEALIYMRELVLYREPKISSNDLKNVIDKINDMSKTKYSENLSSIGYDTRDLIVSALHDISAPTDISQEDIGTCGATCIQIQLALKKPLEYLNMINLLAQDKTYTSLNGGEIKPNWTFTKEGFNSNIDTKRTISSKIMQNAINDFSDGEYKTFDSTKNNDGLRIENVKYALNSIFQNILKTYDSSNYTPSQLIEVLKNSKPSLENPIQISLSYNSNARDSYHAVNVIDVDEKNNKTTIINPWGRKETFELAELKNRIFEINANDDLDKNIAKKTDSDIEKIDKENYHLLKLNNDGISNFINSNNSEANKFLDGLSLKQKVSIISKINSGSLSSDDKKAIVKIFENIFQGSQVQNKLMFEKLATMDKNIAELYTKFKK